MPKRRRPSEERSDYHDELLAFRERVAPMGYSFQQAMRLAMREFLAKRAGGREADSDRECDPRRRVDDIF